MSEASDFEAALELTTVPRAYAAGLLAILSLIPAAKADTVGYCFANRKCMSNGQAVSYDPSSDEYAHPLTLPCRS